MFLLSQSSCFWTAESPNFFLMIMIFFSMLHTLKLDLERELLVHNPGSLFFNAISTQNWLFYIFVAIVKLNEN